MRSERRGGRCEEGRHSPERPAGIAPSRVGGEDTDIQPRHSRSDRWTANLSELGMSGTRVEKLMEGMVSQVLKELTAIYSTRYALLCYDTTQKAQNE